MNFEDQGFVWVEITTLKEMSEGKRIFMRGPEVEKPGSRVTPDVVDAFERFGTDNYGGIVDTKAGLIAALKQLGLPVKE